MKKNRKYLVYILFIISLITIIIVYTKGKYNVKTNTEHIQNSEKFYFKSNLLSEEEIEPIEYKNWDGKGSYEINFSLQNFQDELQINSLKTTYEVNVVNESKNENIEVETFINGKKNAEGEMQGKIKTTDTVTIKLNKKSEATETSTTENNETINLDIIVTSKEPYTKKMSRNIIISKSTYSLYDVNLVEADSKEYVKLLIQTHDFSGILNIEYDTTKAELDTYSEKYVVEALENGEKRNIKINFEKNKNYQIEFRKKDITHELTLGQDIELK